MKPSEDTKGISKIEEGLSAVRLSIGDESAAQTDRLVQSPRVGGRSVGSGFLSPAPASTYTATNYPYVVVYALS